MSVPLKTDWRKLLDASASFVTLTAGVVLLGMLLWPSSGPDRRVRLPSSPEEVPATISVGSVDAPVVVVEYADFECPFSARAARQTLPPILAGYVRSGRARFVLRHLPLPQHRFAREAAAAAECAAKQGNILDFHNALYADQKNLDRTGLLGKAKAAKLQLEAFGQCLDDPATLTSVDADAASARIAGVSITPTFLIGRRRADGLVDFVNYIEGVAPVQTLVAAIDHAHGSSERPHILLVAAASGLVLAGVGVVVIGRRMRKKMGTATAGSAASTH